jgi:large subunit ribosomal protein L19
VEAGEKEKERLQMFSGIVIARKGSGLSETFSLYRVSYGSGMERVFMLHSPSIARIEVIKPGKVRKAKLYYLRGRFGKASKVKELLEGVNDQNGEAYLTATETSNDGTISGSQEV